MHHQNSRPPELFWLTSCLLILACVQSAPAQASPTPDERKAAALSAAQSDAACDKIKPFYMEIGDKDQLLVGASIEVDPTSTTASYGRDDPMLIASASKWWFAAYVAELRSGVISSSDLEALRMLSGYRSLNYSSCTMANADKQANETVQQCYQAGNNNYQTKGSVGYFYYNGGHFQKYAAVDLKLGAMNSVDLASAITDKLGTDLGIAYDSPQLAAGGQTDPAHYVAFLQKLLMSGLKLGGLLGTDAVCAWEDNSTLIEKNKTCTAKYSPVPRSMHWQYSLGHWVEDDGSYSSPGAFGFYPWISKDKTLYGLLAREDHSSNAYTDSIACGRVIRNAYLNPPAP